MALRAPRALVALAFLAFVSLGLPDGVLGVAWPSLRRAFGRPIDQLGLILLATMAGYLVSSSSAGPVLERLGLGRLLVASGLLLPHLGLQAARELGLGGGWFREPDPPGGAGMEYVATWRRRGA